ncbi:hypothetical protein KR009_002445 [Drosophila setifemur]|nr:hypothetical protein KR009_002445 [Drosophila setifemur]
MAGIVLYGIAACRRTSYCLGLLRASCRYRGGLSSPSMGPNVRRRKHDSSTTESGDSGESKPFQQGSQSQKEEPARGAGGFSTAQSPPDPPEVPGERRPEAPLEARPELPYKVHPQTSPVGPPPIEIKPQSPQPITCSSDTHNSKGPFKYSGFQLGVRSGSDIKSKDEATEDASSADPQQSASPAGSDQHMHPQSPIVEFINDPKYQRSSESATELESSGSPPSESQGSVKSKDEPKIHITFPTDLELASQVLILAKPKDVAQVEPQSSTESAPQKKSDPESDSSPSADQQSIDERASPAPFSKLSKTEPKPEEPSSSIFELKPDVSSTESKDKPVPQASNASSLDTKPQISSSPTAKECVHKNFTLPILTLKEVIPEESKDDLKMNVIDITPKSDDANRCLNLRVKSQASHIFSAELQDGESGYQTPLQTSTSADSPGRISGIQTSSGFDQMEGTYRAIKEELGAGVNESQIDRIEEAEEDVVDRDVINKWVQKFKAELKAKEEAALAQKNTDLASTTTTASAHLEDNKGTQTPSVTKYPGTPVETSNPKSQLFLPLKIVPKDEAPTPFIQSLKPISLSDLKMEKDRPSTAESKETPTIEFIKKHATDASLKGSSPSDFHQSTAEIVAMFKDDTEADQTKTEEGSVKDLFDQLDQFDKGQDRWWTQPELPKATESSPPEVLATVSMSSGNEDEKTQTEVGHLDDSNKGDTDKKNDDKDILYPLGNLDSSIQEPSPENENKIIQTDKDYFEQLGLMDSRIRDEEIGQAQEIEENPTNEPVGTEEVDAKEHRVELAEKISTFLKAVKDEDHSNSNVLSSSELTPGELYDPVSEEISLISEITEMGMSELAEGDEEARSLEAFEVKEKEDEIRVQPIQALDETKTKVDDKEPNVEKEDSKKKPELDDGELSLKLKDKITGQPPKGELPSAPGEKSLMQYLFDKILGKEKKGDNNKRQMSTYTGRRYLSTSCSFDFLPGHLTPKGHQPTEPELSTPVRMCLQQPELQPPALDMFAKKDNKKDETKIQGGSPKLCAKPRKSPRELLKEKQESRNIEILGGSEECSKKMKHLKELTEKKDDDDDCSANFSDAASRFFRQLWFSIFSDATSHSTKAK